MAGTTEFIGVDNVLRNLNRAIKQIAGKTEAGVTSAALYVKAQSVKNTPIDLGNLRNSAYVIFPTGREDNAAPTFVGPQAGKVAESTTIAKTGAKAGLKSQLPWAPAAMIGFGAYYAVFVHEIQKAYNKGDWKFLERVLVEDQDKILKIIRDEAKI